MLNIALGGVCAGISLSPGSSCQLIAASAESKAEVLDSLLGQVKSCVVGADGGLISNLSVRENIALPAEFNRVGSDADRASRLNELAGSFAASSKGTPDSSISVRCATPVASAVRTWIRRIDAIPAGLNRP